MRFFAAFALSICWVICSGQANGEDYFLTIGGGYSPTGNQVSLEKNVLLFQRLLAEQQLSDSPHDIFFADGEDEGRDLQYQNDAPLPRAYELVARVFRQTKYQKYQYRNHEIPGACGISSRTELEKWFNEKGAKLKPSDRLFIYVTAHGGKSADKKKPQNTKLYLWNRQSIVVSDFVNELDKVPSHVPVTMVMVQCYSGGFANVIFNEGDAGKGFTNANRCGFFATVHDRVAAGCTPDINEENYREYSTYFWSALRGRTRSDAAIESPDYNEDGVVSLAEAHAYTQLTSPTIDIPIKTSDAFLRNYSKLRPAKPKDHEAELLGRDSPFDELWKAAQPMQRKMMDRLSEELQLKRQDRAAEAVEFAGKLMVKKTAVDSNLKKKATEYSAIATRIKGALQNRYPELYNPWHPKVAEILTRQGDAVVQFIESHREFAKFQKLADESKQLSNEKFDLDRQWVKCQRLVRELENIAYAENLRTVADDATQQRFAQLMQAENAAFPTNPTKVAGGSASP